MEKRLIRPYPKPFWYATGYFRWKGSALRGRVTTGEMTHKSYDDPE